MMGPRCRSVRFGWLECVKTWFWLLVLVSQRNYCLASSSSSSDRRNERAQNKKVPSTKSQKNDTSTSCSQGILWELPAGLARLEASVQTANSHQAAAVSSSSFSSCSSSCNNVIVAPDQESDAKLNTNLNSNGAFHRRRMTTDEVDDATTASMDGIEEGSVIDIHENVLGPNMTWPIDNDLFHGRMCILIRDHPRCDYDFDGENDVFFELQIQGKFKRQPQGPLYLSLELPQLEKFKLSWPVRTAMNALVAFIRSWGYKYLHMSFGGKGETPHLSTPAFQAFDRLIITDKTQNPPPLGHPIPETYNQTIIRKELKFHHQIDISSTYTMSFNHTYMNPVEWKVYGIPLINSVDLSFTDVLRLVIHEVVEEDGQQFYPFTHGDVQSVAHGRHTRRNIAMWVQLRRKNQEFVP